MFPSLSMRRIQMEGPPPPCLIMARRATVSVCTSRPGPWATVIVASALWRLRANNAALPLLVRAFTVVHGKDRRYSLSPAVAGLPRFLNSASASTLTMMYFSAAGARTKWCRPGRQVAGSASSGLMSLGLMRQTHWGADVGRHVYQVLELPCQGTAIRLAKTSEGHLVSCPVQEPHSSF